VTFAPDFARKVTALGAARRLSRVTHADEPLSNEAALEALATDASFRAALLSWLADEPFRAFFWELPPLSRQRVREPFEFVVSDAPGLERVVADASPFREPLGAADGDGIAEFENLGGDAWLVAPEPRGEQAPYAHLASFVRGAPEAQRHALLQRTAQATLLRLSERPLWISTSGLGVYWLHVRLDSWPKYYQYGPYKRWPCV
jgi:hypothetical protein